MSPWWSGQRRAWNLAITAWYFTTGGQGLTDGDYVGVTDYTGAGVQECTPMAYTATR